MTFSLVARCTRTRQMGIAITSSSIAVGARCSHVRAGVGVVASQNITDPALGPLVLDRLARRESAAQALEGVLAGHVHRAYRQVLALGVEGPGAAFSGEHALGVHGTVVGRDCVAGGNLLACPGVPEAMVATFEATEGDLGSRLIAALAAGLAAGGEAGPLHSAGLKIADALDWPPVDLRVDWSDAPIAQLGMLWSIYRPQIAPYVHRAVAPDRAPPFGVPGER